MADTTRTSRWRFWLKALAPALASIGGLLLFRWVTHGAIDRDVISEWLLPLGALAPLGFVLLLAARPLSLLPGAVFIAVAGMLFGPMWGTVYALVGSFLSSLLIFLLARAFGGRLMRRVAGPDYVPLREVAKVHGFQFSLVTCINPLFPTDVAQAVAAASGARFRDIAAGVLIGTFPGTLLTAEFGSAIGEGRAVLTAVSAAGMMVSLVLGVVVGRRAFGTFRKMQRARDGLSLLRAPRAVG